MAFVSIRFSHDTSVFPGIPKKITSHKSPVAPFSSAQFINYSSIVYNYKKKCNLITKENQQKKEYECILVHSYMPIRRKSIHLAAEFVSPL